MTIWRTSTYEGSGAVSVSGENATTVYVVGGTATYHASTFRGATCGRYDNQISLVTVRGAMAPRVYWRGWVRPVTVPDANRLIVSLGSADTAQATIAVDTAQKWRLRNETGVTVATSTNAFVTGEWYGLEWWADSTGAGQQLKIYDSSSTLLETLAGACGTLALTRHQEGILQGTTSWVLDYDDTALGDQPLVITAPGAPLRTGMAKVWDGSSWISRPAKTWNGAAWVSKNMQAWDGASWKQSK